MSEADTVGYASHELGLSTLALIVDIESHRGDDDHDDEEDGDEDSGSGSRLASSNELLAVFTVGTNI